MVHICTTEYYSAIKKNNRKKKKNNRMRKTRDLFKKIRDTKGTSHAKMGSIKDQKQYGPHRSRRY